MNIIKWFKETFIYNKCSECGVKCFRNNIMCDDCHELFWRTPENSKHFNLVQDFYEERRGFTNDEFKKIRDKLLVKVRYEEIEKSNKRLKKLNELIK